MDITQFTGQRTDLINAILDNLQVKVLANQRVLYQLIIDEFVDKLETKGGIIQNTTQNKRLLALFDAVFKKYTDATTPATIKTLLDGVQQIIDFNAQYFAVLAPKSQLIPIKTDVQKLIDSWLGISSDGKTVPNGYLDTLINDPTVKNQIRNVMIKGIVNQVGNIQLKQDLKDYITGNNQGTVAAGETGSAPDTGALSKYYRNFVYDTYSQLDRATANTYANTLELNYAIYEGGIIRTSRKFCKDHNGKVYSRAEIAVFDPPTAQPPGYNPFVDLGGYGCRHHLNWIPEIIAFSMRPDLKPA
jgi:hypothetical protein